MDLTPPKSWIDSVDVDPARSDVAQPGISLGGGGGNRSRHHDGSVSTEAQLGGGTRQLDIGPNPHAWPLRIVDGFCGMGSLSQVASLLGHQVVGFYDSDAVGQDECETNHPFAAVGGDIESAFADPSFHYAVATADVSFAIPPCGTFSWAGNGALDNAPDGKHLVGHFKHALSAKPLAHFIEIVDIVATADGGRLLEHITGTAWSYGYVCYHKVLTPQDFGGPQNRTRLFVGCFREDVDDAVRPFQYLEPTTPARNATVRSCLDHPDKKERKTLTRKKRSKKERIYTRRKERKKERREARNNERKKERNKQTKRRKEKRNEKRKIM